MLNLLEGSPTMPPIGTDTAASNYDPLSLAQLKNKGRKSGRDRPRETASGLQWRPVGRIKPKFGEVQTLML